VALMIQKVFEFETKTPQTTEDLEDAGRNVV
jgi:hypothetical protein